MPRVPGSLRALLTGLIDYAGLFPPAALPLAIVEERYRGFRASPDCWILGRLVLPSDKLPGITLDPGCRVTLLVDDPPGPLPAAVESLETRNLALESALPVYYEAPVEQIHRGYAKIRTGGLTADAIPSTAHLARFLADAAARRLPFKATAGLHHPVRSDRPLTYALDSLRAAMHGFLNVFVGAALAWHGLDAASLAALLDERDPKAFVFDADELTWRGLRLTTDQIRDARRDFAHSFGSCSFEEPVAELRELGLLP